MGARFKNPGSIDIGTIGLMRLQTARNWSSDTEATKQILDIVWEAIEKLTGGIDGSVTDEHGEGSFEYCIYKGYALTRRRFRIDVQAKETLNRYKTGSRTFRRKL